MKSVELLMSEHKYIKRMLQVVRTMAQGILKDNELNKDDLYQAMDFIRNYADQHHHMKEEKVLFKYMKDELGEMVNAPIEGMFIEHNFGRMYIMNIENAVALYDSSRTEARLEIIANAIAYTNLLSKHIDKEDMGIYQYGEKNLSHEMIEKIECETQKLEAEALTNGVQKKYLDILRDLEKKYHI